MAKNNNNTFKPTPIGMIPKDWEVMNLGCISVIKGEYGINAAAVNYKEFLPTYLRITDIDEDGKFLSLDKKSVNDDASNKFILEDEDIVIARTGATVPIFITGKASV